MLHIIYLIGANLRTNWRNPQQSSKVDVI